MCRFACNTTTFHKTHNKLCNQPLICGTGFDPTPTWFSSIGVCQQHTVCQIDVGIDSLNIVVDSGEASKHLRNCIIQALNGTESVTLPIPIGKYDNNDLTHSNEKLTTARGRVVISLSCSRVLCMMPMPISTSFMTS
jgi:hypothetical protein